MTRSVRQRPCSTAFSLKFVCGAQGAVQLSMPLPPVSPRACVKSSLVSKRFVPAIVGVALTFVRRKKQNISPIFVLLFSTIATQFIGLVVTFSIILFDFNVIV